MDKIPLIGCISSITCKSCGKTRTGSCLCMSYICPYCNYDATPEWIKNIKYADFGTISNITLLDRISKLNFTHPCA